MNNTEAIKVRRSVRTYTGKPISELHRNSTEAELNKLSLEYGVRLAFVENNFRGKQFGTYGFIKNAAAYIACSCKNDKFSVVNAGTALEKAVLHCTALGIGTCWLGGTFKRDEFGSALSVYDDEIIPAVIAAGYPEEKERFIGGLVRMGAKSSTRKPFGDLFFDGDFSSPLSQSDTFATDLEMVRIGPSASNKQPWRIAKDGDKFHFFLAHTPAYSTRYAFDMQLLDIGIAIAHFEISTQMVGKIGEWQVLDKDFGDLPPNTEYIISWLLVV